MVVDFGDGAVASLTGYPIGSEPKLIGDDFPALFRLLQELENRALESWYVNVLARYPESEARTWLAATQPCGTSSGEEALRRMSVIVANNNAGARRLYERHGYEVAATLACVKEAWETDTEHWVLLNKSLRSVADRSVCTADVDRHHSELPPSTHPRRIGNGKIDPLTTLVVAHLSVQNPGREPDLQRNSIRALSCEVIRHIWRPVTRGRPSFNTLSTGRCTSRREGNRDRPCARPT